MAPHARFPIAISAVLVLVAIVFGALPDDAVVPARSDTAQTAQRAMDGAPVCAEPVPEQHVLAHHRVDVTPPPEFPGLQASPSPRIVYRLARFTATPVQFEITLMPQAMPYGIDRNSQGHGRAVLRGEPYLRDWDQPSRR